MYRVLLIIMVLGSLVVKIERSVSSYLRID